MPRALPNLMPLVPLTCPRCLAARRLTAQPLSVDYAVLVCAACGQVVYEWVVGADTWRVPHGPCTTHSPSDHPAVPGLPGHQPGAAGGYPA